MKGLLVGGVVVLVVQIGVSLACKGPTEAKRPLGIENACPCPTVTPTAFVEWKDRGIPGPSPTPQMCWDGNRVVGVWAVGYDVVINRCGSFSEFPPTPTRTPVPTP